MEDDGMYIVHAGGPVWRDSHKYKRERTEWADLRAIMTKDTCVIRLLGFEDAHDARMFTEAALRLRMMLKSGAPDPTLGHE